MTLAGPCIRSAAAGSASAKVLRPITLLGVAALGEPDLLIEIDATAVLG
jgi:hypothetical protein